MKITVEQLVPWSVALDIARETENKPPLGKEPSYAFKERMIEAEHSPIRAVLYKIRMEAIPYWVSVHLVRHKFGVEHFVSTQRTDRTGVERGNKRQDAPVNHTMIVNAQEILFISRRRLCSKASRETRELWTAVVKELEKCDPALAAHCRPMCYYRGKCPELKSCGMYSAQSAHWDDSETLNNALAENARLRDGLCRVKHLVEGECDKFPIGWIAQEIEKI